MDFDGWDAAIATPPDSGEVFFCESDASWEAEYATVCKLVQSTVLDSQPRPKKKIVLPYYANEMENRLVLISNIHPDTTVRELEIFVNQFGAVDSISMNPAEHRASVKFYDLRHAYNLRAAEIWFHRRRCMMAFGPGEEVTNKRKPPNNGTIELNKTRVSDSA
ncbi:MAG: hypothetical protein LBG60_13155 [Bifidobacteriaceae bacterium]|jgi:hypothetical protein|nr:hypothetical protein [Bifidobacteriaceae bacterium]